MPRSDREGGAGGLEEARHQAVRLLCEHFAVGRLGLEEFERRVDLAHRASVREELGVLLTDLPGGLPNGSGEHETVLAVVGGRRRGGVWTPARTSHVIAILGGAELDLRDALFRPGLTDLVVYAVGGGVEVIVPPGFAVESRGLSLLGVFEQIAGGRGHARAASRLRVRGMALAGRVEITERHSGERAREARQRRRGDENGRAQGPV